MAHFNNEIKFVKHMSDYFSEYRETFLADECGTYEILGKPEFGITGYARKIYAENFYDYLNIGELQTK